MGIADLLKSEQGAIVISIILGLGLAALFRKACADNSCIVIKGPKTEDVKGSLFKIDKTCYKYDQVMVDCNKDA